jgi:hypothetical protein
VLHQQTKNLGKIFFFLNSLYFRWKFMKIVSNFFDSEECLTKIKVEEPIKIIAFDEKNARLTVMTHERILYFFDIPEQ